MNKYRVSDLVGNYTVTAILRRSIANNSLPRLSAFLGVMGTGKTTSANAAAMALSCQNPQDGEACLVCPRCKHNIKTLEGSGSGQFIKSVNMSAIDSKKGITELVNEIFSLVPESSNAIYILNEFHALKNLGDNAQTIFLEEFDRMPSNVYVFITSTHAQDILPTIISRGMEFNFGRLTQKDARFLLDKECRAHNYSLVDDELRELIIQSCNGIPRDIIKSLKFLSENQVTVREYKEFIGIIPDSDYYDLLVSMKSTQIREMINSVDLLLEKKKNSKFVDGLKDFFLKCIYYKEAKILDGLDIEEEELASAIEDINLFKILKELEKLNYRSSDTDIKLALYQIRNTIIGRTTLDVIADSSKVAHVSTSIARDNFNQTSMYSTQSRQTKGATPVTMDLFNTLE